MGRSDRKRSGIAGERGAVVGENKQMCPLFSVEAKSAGNLLQEMGRHLDRAALLKPRVPGQADAGEVRNLLTAQARRSPSFGDRQVDVGWNQSRTPGSQKVGEFLSRRSTRVPWQGMLEVLG
jgi:hypothetical protein